MELRRQSRLDEKTRILKEKERKQRWEAERPEREKQETVRAEQAERDAEIRNRTAQAESKDLERRKSARQQLLLCYHEHSPTISESISWERFEQYNRDYLGDSLPAEQVEQNAERMMEMIVGQFEAGTPAPVYRSATEIKAQYDQEREEIQASDFDDQTKESMLADIAFREAMAISEERI